MNARLPAVFLLALCGCHHATLPASTDAGTTSDDAGAADGAGLADGGAAPSLRTVLNEQYLPALEPLLDGARSSVWVVHFEMNNDSDGDAIEARLVACAARGVSVHVVLESSVASNPARVAHLNAAGAHATLAAASHYTHAKLVVVDGAHALFGSTNWSYSSMEKNNESSLLVENSPAVGYYEKYAQAIFADSADSPVLDSVTTELGTTMKEGDYAVRAGAMIDAATKRIHLVVYGMNADPKYPGDDVWVLIKKMADAVKRGVEVRIILEISNPDLGVNTVNTQAVAALHAAGIPDVRFDPPDRITHAKVLIVDGAAIVGSNNWGYGGFHLYHEVGMATQVPAVIQSLSDYFDGIWAVSTPAP